MKEIEQKINCQPKKEKYSDKLEKMLRKYERIIQSQLGMIQELQEKVYEYLHDALEK